MIVYSDYNYYDTKNYIDNERNYTYLTIDIVIILIFMIKWKKQYGNRKEKIKKN